MTDKSARWAGISIVATGVLVVLALGLWQALLPRVAHVDIDKSRYPVTGVDLSAHNGRVNFDTLSAAGVDFVYLKASEGESFKDAAFVSNYAAARRCGIPVGAYHFFRFDRDGARQARNFLAATIGCCLDLPMVVDVEEYGNPAGVSTEMIRTQLQLMVATLRQAGRKVMIYTNKNGHARFVRHVFDSAVADDPELWICSFTDPPLARHPWILWQHSHRGTIPGVDGPVDLNTFNGDRIAWDTWLAANGARTHGTQ